VKTSVRPETLGCVTLVRNHDLARVVPTSLFLNLFLSTIYSKQHTGSRSTHVDNEHVTFDMDISSSLVHILCIENP
jgi:hypothetical protein